MMSYKLSSKGKTLYNTRCCSAFCYYTKNSAKAITFSASTLFIEQRPYDNVLRKENIIWLLQLLCKRQLLQPVRLRSMQSL